MKDTSTERKKKKKIKTNLWRYGTCDKKSRLNYVIKQNKNEKVFIDANDVS